MPALHAYLMQLQNHTPTLKELGVKFGESPQGLNNAFVQAYGESIFSMLTSYRLNQAHAALLDSNVAIKTLAARLGYAHGNAFAYAFKHKFGYTPGSLRHAPQDLVKKLELA
jgi:AraC-like DNA-binding protein